MTTYKGIRGLTIRTIDGDASPLIAGDIWYNSAARKIKGSKLPAGTWTSGGNLNQARTTRMSGAPSNSAAITAGGYKAGLSPATQGLAETYDGSSWTEVADLNTARKFSTGFGTSTSAIVVGGDESPKANSEEWNGSSWTEVGDLNTGRDSGAGVGTEPAALCIGGGTPSAVDNVESWNGSAWTNGTALNTAKKHTW